MVADPISALWWQAKASVPQANEAELALTVAEMLAAAVRCPTPAEDVPGFCDLDRELSAAGWQTIRRMLRDSDEGRNALFESVSGMSMDARPVKCRTPHPDFVPGGVEALRRSVLALMPTAAVADKSPPFQLDILRAVLAHAQNHSDYVLPEPILTLCATMAQLDAPRTIYLAYDGLAPLALEFSSRDHLVRYELQNSYLAELCACLAAAGNCMLEICLGNPLNALSFRPSAESPREKTLKVFDCAIVLPPFGGHVPETFAANLGPGLPIPNSLEAAGVALAVFRGSQTAIAIVSQGFLSKTTKLDQAFKQRLLQRSGLDVVVGLPPGSFGRTTGVQGALLRCQPAKTCSTPASEPSVLLIDARPRQILSTARRGELQLRRDIQDIIQRREEAPGAVLVKQDDLLANDYNLSIERYVASREALRLQNSFKGQNFVALEDVAELYRPQAIPISPGGEADETLLEVGVGDISETGPILPPSREVVIDAVTARRAKDVVLRTGDVLIVSKGSVGKIGFVRQAPEEGDETRWLAGQSFVVARVRQNGALKDARVLFRYLSSAYGSGVLRSLGTGNVIPNLKMPDLKRLPVPLPSLSEQHRIGEEVEDLFRIQDQIQCLRADLEERARRIWPEEVQSMDFQ